MKRIISALALLLVTQTAFADAWTITRSHCFLQKRFVANARVSALAFTTYSTGYNAWGQWVGTSPRAAFYDQCNSSRGGCSRPYTAECQRSGTINDITYSGPFGMITGTHSFWGHARMHYDVGGGQHSIRRTSGRGIAGFIKDQAVDSAKVAALTSEGWSSGYTEGSVEIDEDGNLHVSGLSGSLAIYPNSDQFSMLKVIVIRERDDLTEAQAAELEQRMSQGDFGDVVHTSEIRVDRNGIYATGIFAHVDENQMGEFSNQDSTGVTLKDFKTKKRLEVSLGEHESLSVIFLNDGGFDISSAVITTPLERRANTSAPFASNELSNALTSFEPEVFPNPVTQGTLNIRAFAEKEQETLKVELSDAAGRVSHKLHEVVVGKGAIELSNIRAGHVPAGLYFCRITVGDKVFIRKITIQ